MNKARFLTVVTLLSLLICNISYSAEVKNLDFQRLSTEITESKEIKVLFLFASWCRHCKEAIPQLIKLSSDSDLKDKIKVFYISLDAKPDLLERFSNSLNNDLVIYRLIKSSDISDLFRKFSINYSGSVPHIVIMNDNSLVISDNHNSILSVKKSIDKYIENK